MPVIRFPGVQPIPPGAEGWCGWDVNPTCADWATYTEAQQDAALSIAVAVMWAATGRRFGPCELTVRPCQSREVAETYRAFPVWWGANSGWVDGGLPYLFGGQWFNSCGCGPRCCCRPRCQIALDGPVSSIVQVTVDGVIVPDSDYRVDVAQGVYYLVKLTAGCWPTCQDFNVGGNDAGSFVVVQTRGATVPASVIAATEILSCEFGKQIVGAECALPPRMQSLTRQGVTAQFITSEIDVDTFQTGISLVDMVIRAQNPSRRTRPPTVVSPDMPTDGDRMTVVGGP